MNSAWKSSCVVQSWFVLSGMQAESSILWEEQTLLFSRLADGHKWPFLHHEGSSFVLPPTPGNETKSPERNFHPRLIMKRISLITLVDCGHCSASFSKKKRRKKLLKVFQCIALIVSQAECKSIRYIFFSVPIYCIAQFCLFYFPALDFCSCLCLQQSLQLTLKGISQLCSWYKYFFIAPESLTQLMIEYFPV